MRLKYSLLIGETSAESLKIGVATAIKDKEHFYIVRGRSLEEGIPKSVKVGSFEIYETLLPLYEKIVQSVSDLLKEAPPELSGDISDRGIIMSGGGSLIRGISDYFSNALNVKVIVTSDPLTAVVRGCAKILEGKHERD
jgi:rod shape-determining protein MreB